MQVECYRDPEVLRRLYIDEGLTIMEMAERLYCSRSAVATWMRRAGLSGKPHGARCCKKARLYDCDGEMLTLAQIAERTGLTPATTWSRINRCGLRPAQLLADPKLGSRQRGMMRVRIGSGDLTVEEIAAMTGLKKTTIRQRIRYGFGPDRLILPLQHRGRRKKDGNQDSDNRNSARHGRGDCGR